jgi:type IV secretory pathway VirJ component
MVLALMIPPRVEAARQAATMRVPTFGTVTIYRGPDPPQQIVLFVSGDGGWNLGVVDMAQRLRDLGALVVGIDIRQFIKSLEASGSCAYPAGALEELSRAVQLQFRLPSYKRPILAGYSSGATLVYAALAAAPPETFAGAISLGFCPDLEIQKPLCQMRGLKAARRPTGSRYDLAPFPGSSIPWMVLQGDVDQVCDPWTTRHFVAETGASRVFALPLVGHGFGVPARWTSQFLEAFRTIAKNSLTPLSPLAAAPAVADLSLVEALPQHRSDGHVLAVVLSGDGGWTEIDKSIAADLSGAGVPVVGWSSLDYYWRPRTPEGAAADLARIVEHYTTAWQKERVLVIGYSFGADVAPFLVNRLPDPAKNRIANVVLLSPSQTATFEFHLAMWLGGGADPRYPTAPEIARLSIPVTCVSASDQSDSVCRTVKSARLRTLTIGRGHHFSGEYGRIVEEILRELEPAPRLTAASPTSRRLDPPASAWINDTLATSLRVRMSTVMVVTRTLMWPQQ